MYAGALGSWVDLTAQRLPTSDPWPKRVSSALGELRESACELSNIEGKHLDTYASLDIALWSA